MPRIDEMPEFRAKLPKNVHNLSHKFGFTATVGHLLPVFHDFVNPGETVELSVDYNLRTQPLQSAAMVELRSHVEYFFVPINLLYEPFGNMFFNINDSYSSLFPNYSVQGDKIQQRFPLMDFQQFNQTMQSHDVDVVGFEDWLNHCYRLFDMLGYNPNHLNQVMEESRGNFNPNVFPYPILAYNCIYQYYYRLDTREHFDQNAFNWDKFFKTPLVDSDLWDFTKYVRLYYRPKGNDYFMDQKVSPIVDVLNLNSEDLTAAQDWLSGNTNISPEAGSSLAQLYTTFAQQIGSVPGGFTGQPNYQDGLDNTTVVKNGASSELKRIYFNTDNAASIQPAAQGQNIFNQFQTPHTHSIDGITGSSLNTANIRALFATEKLWSITGRARKHYDDQTLAHFGVKVPHDPKHQISVFGHDSGVIPIGEVISTSNSLNEQGQYGGLGEIAGKGYGSLQSKKHRFKAPCHGVVMAILSFVPDVAYGNTYLKANALVDKNDLYQPEYDHLGMQPVFGYEGNASAPQAVRNSITGWQYRYEQWKRRFNRVSHAFQSTGSLDSWMLDFYAPTQVDAANTENYLEYLHDPSELNQIMLVNYYTSVPMADESKTYDGDPFVVDSFIKCRKISSMSDYSLPRLDA